MKNYFTIILFSLLNFVVSGLSGQNQLNRQNQVTCATELPDMQWEERFEQLIEGLVKNEAGKQQQAQVYTIPVIIHVIHNGEMVGTYPNLAQGQLVSQIRVLNDDFGGIGFNSWNYPSTAYSTWANTQSVTASSLDALGRVKIANCNVQFCLATKDTLGNVLPEPGIDRINRSVKGWTIDPGSFSTTNAFKNYMDNTIKPQSIWNVSKYLNIWVSDIDINSTGLLGYATFPLLTGLPGLQSANGTALTDGIWCFSQAFGSAGYFPSGNFYNTNTRGRTSSHEVGHWLGLRHIWGDGNCADDFCADTPPATASNFGNPSYPLKVGQCTDNAPNGEMFMNIMDYSNDNAKYMFTPDQATRVLTSMQNSPYRKFLGNHNLCSVAPIATTASFNVVSSACASTPIVLANITGGTPLPTYSWSASGPGSAVFIPDNASAIAVSFTGPGVYTITLNSTNGNSSTISKTINVNPSPNLVISIPSQTVCYNSIISLNASGANTYTWEPEEQVGNNAVYLAIESQVFTCVATGAFNCKATATIDITVQNCNGISPVVNASNLFNIFPNPFINELTLELNNTFQSGLSVEIYDASGKLMSKGKYEDRKGSGQIQINTTDYTKGIYLIRLKSDDGRQQTLKVVKD